MTKMSVRQHVYIVYEGNDTYQFHFGEPCDVHNMKCLHVEDPSYFTHPPVFKGIPLYMKLTIKMHKEVYDYVISELKCRFQEPSENIWFTMRNIERDVNHIKEAFHVKLRWATL